MFPSMNADDDDDALSVLMLLVVGWMGQMMRHSCLTDTGEEEEDGCEVMMLMMEGVNVHGNVSDRDRRSAWLTRPIRLFPIQRCNRHCLEMNGC